jgi:hypothetical protein
MKVTLEMSEDDLKILRAYLVVSLDRGVVRQDTHDIVCSAANQLDKQLYPGRLQSTLRWLALSANSARSKA